MRKSNSLMRAGQWWAYLGIDRYRVLSGFLLATAIVWARQPPSKLFLSLSLCLFPSSGVFSALQHREIEEICPGFLFYHSSDQAGLPTHLQTTGYRQKRS